MKLITAIIKPDKVEVLRKALTDVELQGLTITEAKGYGRQKGHTEMYRGAEYDVHFLPKSRAEILVFWSFLLFIIGGITLFIMQSFFVY